MWVYVCDRGIQKSCILNLEFWSSTFMAHNFTISVLYKKWKDHFEKYWEMLSIKILDSRQRRFHDNFETHTLIRRHTNKMLMLHIRKNEGVLAARSSQRGSFRHWALWYSNEKGFGKGLDLSLLKSLSTIKLVIG